MTGRPEESRMKFPSVCRKSIAEGACLTGVGVGVGSGVGVPLGVGVGVGWGCGGVGAGWADVGGNVGKTDDNSACLFFATKKIPAKMMNIINKITGNLIFILLFSYSRPSRRKRVSYFTTRFSTQKIIYLPIPKNLTSLYTAAKPTRPYTVLEYYINIQERQSILRQAQDFSIII